MPFLFVRFADGRLWLAGQDPLVSSHGATETPQLQFKRARRQAQDRQFCLGSAIVQSGNICAGPNSCSSTAGILTDTNINNLFNNVVLTNIQVNINSTIVSRVRTELTAVSTIELDFDNRISTRVEAEHDLEAANEIVTKARAELGTVKGQLDGEFKLASRLGTVEADVEADVEVETNLSVMIGPIRTQLDLEAKATIKLDAELTGAQANLNTAAFMGAGMGTGVGLLLSVPVTVLLYNKLHNHRWWCW